MFILRRPNRLDLYDSPADNTGITHVKRWLGDLPRRRRLTYRDTQATQMLERLWKDGFTPAGT